MRVGHGFDVHRFDVEAGPAQIKLGGVLVPSDHPVLAHSDGDVVLHAICDALLGASALGDIGEWFPDSEAQWAGADSRALLAAVHLRVSEQGYRVLNLDVTVIAQVPRLGQFKGAMKLTIAETLQCSPAQVNIKATTTEKLGFIGREEGIATEAVCLLEPTL